MSFESKDLAPAEPDAWRLLGLDIDGTLMHWGGEISPAVIEAIEQVRMCRTHAVLATGRNIVATVPVAQMLGIRRGYAVCSNGAVTIRLNPGTPGGYDIVETITFNPRPALELIRQEMPDAYYAVEELCHDEVTRVVIRAPGADVSHFDELVQRVGLNDVTYAVGYSAWLDLTPPGVSKASALETLRKHLDVDSAHTVAVGDGNNDLEMLAWAAHSAAMGNAPIRVREAADRVLGSVEDDGVLGLLSQLIDPHRLAVL